MFLALFEFIAPVLYGKLTPKRRHQPETGLGPELLHWPPLLWQSVGIGLSRDLSIHFPETVGLPMSPEGLPLYWVVQPERNVAVGAKPSDWYLWIDQRLNPSPLAWYSTD